MKQYTKYVYEFKNGDVFKQDVIEGIQDLAHADWWRYVDPDVDECVCTRDIKIVIKVIE